MKKIILTVFIISCKSQLDTGTNNGGSGNDTVCYTCGNSTDPSQNRPFYTFSVIAHGSGNISGQPTNVVWTSKTDPTLTDEDRKNIFVTDSNLSFRIIARSNPGRTPGSGGSQIQDTYGRNCYDKAAYTRLGMKLRVRPHSGTAGTAYPTKEFGVTAGIPVDGISEVFTISNVPLQVPNNSSAPFSIEIMDLVWDYYCTPGQMGKWSVPCPMHSLSSTLDCVQFEVQMSTDVTYQFP